MTFWHDPALEPKRAYKFHLIIGGVGSGLAAESTSATILHEYMIKKVSRPSFSTSESEHKYLNHTFYFPGKVTWSEVSFTVTDAISPNASLELMKMLEASGYKAPLGTTNGIDEPQTVSKLKANGALGKPRIQQLDSEGNIVEEWTLFNAWIKDVKFGDLDYDSEELMNIEVTLRYDYAALDVRVNGGRGTGQFPTNANFS